MDGHFADEYLPVWDISDAVVVLVEGERETEWEPLLQIDLLEVGRGHRWSACYIGDVRLLTVSIHESGELDQTFLGVDPA